MHPAHRIHKVTDLRTGEVTTYTPVLTVRDGRTGRIVRQIQTRKLARRG